MKVKHVMSLIIGLLLAVSIPVVAEVEFGGLDLNSTSQLLFKATANVPIHESYDTLFFSNVLVNDLTQLTFFPEEVMYLNETQQFQIQNRYGVFRTSPDDPSMTPISRFPAFVNGDEIATGKINPIKSSPDGRYLLYLDSVSPGYANLILLDLITEKETVITSKVEMTLEGPPATWSPDSQFFIYSKLGMLYYYSVEQLNQGRVLSEDFRLLGEGIISSVQWGTRGELYYVSGSLVYEVLGVELFTRSLYQNMLSIGRIVGKIPYYFDPNFDTFWIAPDGEKILLNRSGRNIFLYYLNNDDFLTIGDTLSLPYLFLPRNTTVKKVLWSNDDRITVLTGSIKKGITYTSIFRLNLNVDEDTSKFTQTDDEGVRGIVLSPDALKIALYTEDEVIIRDYILWKDTKTWQHPEPLHAVWASNEELIVSGRFYSEKLAVSAEDRTVLCLSQPGKYGFDTESGQVRVETDKLIRSWDQETMEWADVEAFSINPKGVASNDFRVYLAQLITGSYRNMVMVRNIQDVGTLPLFNPPKKQYESFPESDQLVDLVNFSHGSRIRRRELSLVFNAVDSVEGLTQILNILAEYGIRATFFINGDFIRRHPGAVQEIADSGHEVGSLFHTYFDMTDSRYQISRDFIKQGLARNEDDYFATTGQELALLWHAPYYFVSPAIIQASKEMNYAYVGRDVDSLDWVPRLTESGIARLYMPVAELIERIVQNKKPGSIVSMRIGRPGDSKPGMGREDYLFQRLDLLLNNLIALGYEVVPVSALMERVK